MDAWPLRHLVLRTPRLELRPDDDAGLSELVEVAKAGVHDPAEMPFSVPWTDGLADDHGLGMVQFFWGVRARLTARDCMAEVCQTLNALDPGDARSLPERRLSIAAEQYRADLAARLLSSLPAVLEDEDDGVAEALRREKEADDDPSACLSLEQFREGLARLRGR